MPMSSTACVQGQQRHSSMQEQAGAFAVRITDQTLIVFASAQHGAKLPATAVCLYACGAHIHCSTQQLKGLAVTQVCGSWSAWTEPNQVHIWAECSALGVLQCQLWPPSAACHWLCIKQCCEGPADQPRKQLQQMLKLKPPHSCTSTVNFAVNFTSPSNA